MKGISLLWLGNAGGPSLTQAPDPGAVRWARGTPPGGHGPQWALCPLPHPTWGPLTAPRLTDVLSDPHLDHHVSMRTCTQARTKQCAHTCDCICTSLKHKAGSTVGGGAGLRPTSIGSHGEKVTGGGGDPAPSTFVATLHNHIKGHSATRRPSAESREPGPGRDESLRFPLQALFMEICPCRLDVLIRFS